MGRQKVKSSLTLPFDFLAFANRLPPQWARRSSFDSPFRGESKGGKSELRRAVRRVTPGQGNLKESGTENTQLTPVQAGKQW